MTRRDGGPDARSLGGPPLPGATGPAGVPYRPRTGRASGTRGIVPRALALVALSCLAARGAGPDATAELVRLVPADAGVTLAVADLRGQVATIGASNLAKSVAALPGVRAWLDSGGGAQLDRARGEVEKALGTSLATIRDDLIGDAVVLSLHLAPDAPPESARGLLLLKARDRAVLARLIDLANNAETAEGVLVEVASLGQGPLAYRARRFKPGGREPEFYRVFEDGTFDWSNSETVLKGVLDRKAEGRGPGLAASSDYRRVRDGLPARSLATAIIAPGFAARVLAAAPKSGDPGDDKAAELVAGGLRSLAGIGLAVEWRDGVILHVHQALKPDAADPRALAWARSKSSPDALARRIPATAIATAAAPVDLAGIYDGLVALVPEGDRTRLDVALDAARGVLLGRGVRDAILPRIGPALIAYVEPPPPGGADVSLVGALELRDDGGVAPAIDNALRTLFNLYALDPSRGALRLKVESRSAGALKVTTLGGGPSPFAYGVGPDCLVVGTSADAVARFGTSSGPDPRLVGFRAESFPEARAYAAVDLVRLAGAARTHRDALARRSAAARGGSVEAAARDLDKVIALLNLFDRAYFAVSVDPELTFVHQTLGLIAK